MSAQSATAMGITTSARAAVRRALLAWYRRTARDLPWRRTRAPYCIWLSEILLQQTRVETVEPYYERFMAALPTVAALAAAPLERVLRLWAGLGYYTRARSLHRAARIIVAEHGGAFPRTAAEWQRLPGIGRYTAGAVASIAYGEPVPAIDGNVRRVLARLCNYTAPLNTQAGQDAIWERAEWLLPRQAPGDFNQALMELGARVCTPRRPRCPDCPVQRWCAGLSAGQPEHLPVRRNRRRVPEVEAVAGVLRRRGQILLVRRPPGLLGGMWTLPTAELRVGQSPVRRLRALLHPGLIVGAQRAIVGHQFTHRRLRVHVHACEWPRGVVHPRGNLDRRWVPPAELDAYVLTTLDRKLLRAALD